RLREQGEIDGVNLLNASGESAQQSISHFHFHLVPRKEGENLDLWPETGYSGSGGEAYDFFKEILDF
ncbi:MAG: HIT domain-containing protein, partial [Candidatus Nanohaloarchaea archaeon]